VSVSLKAVSGVASVQVNLEKGLAAVKMKPGNSTTLKQLQEAVAKNGFTMKQSDATIAGTLVLSNNKTQLKISGSGDTLALTPASKAASSVSLTDGQPVIVTGTISEPSKGKSPDVIVYRSVVEGTTR
jgi:hypothetical protein